MEFGGRQYALRALLISFLISLSNSKFRNKPPNPIPTTVYNKLHLESTETLKGALEIFSGTIDNSTDYCFPYLKGIYHVSFRHPQYIFSTFHSQPIPRPFSKQASNTFHIQLLEYSTFGSTVDFLLYHTFSLNINLVLKATYI